MPNYNPAIISRILNWSNSVIDSLDQSLKFIDPERSVYNISQYLQYDDGTAAESDDSIVCDINGNQGFKNLISNTRRSVLRVREIVSNGNVISLQDYNSLLTEINVVTTLLGKLNEYLSVPQRTFKLTSNILDPIINHFGAANQIGCLKRDESSNDVSFLMLRTDPQLLSTISNLIESSDNLFDDAQDAEEIPPTEPLASVAMNDFTTQKLFDLLERLYRMQNNNFYVVIKRSTESSLGITTMLRDFETTVSYILEVLSRINDQRIELKEARQGIKDLIGLGDKFYPGSVSTIELLEYMTFAHESENNALFEINTRAQEIKSYVEAIRLDTQDIKIYIDQRFNELIEYNTNLHNTITDSLEIIRTDLATQMQQNQQQLIDMIIAIDNQVGR